MQPLLTTALAGTAQVGGVIAATGTELDPLLAALPEGDAERRLLLAAGSAAICRMAGYVPETIAAVPVPVLGETLQLCSPAAADLLCSLLSGRKYDLLLEALDRLRRAGLRLPPQVLPILLDTRETVVRRGLAPVIGTRGRWLASFDEAWAWVNDYPPDGECTPSDDAETIWEEGTTWKRVNALRRVRAVDPARGRQWVQSVWKLEKADVRVDLVRALAVGLGPEDEPLLESAFDDRSPSVREAATKLLGRLPGSALVARMTARADALLTYSDGTLDAQTPETLEPDAMRDGILAKPVKTSYERAWLVTQILSHVPLVHWVERFGMSPDELIAATDGANWRRGFIVEGWTYAAATYQDRRWALPLWSFWGDPLLWQRGTVAHNAYGLRAELAPLVPGEAIERHVLAVLEEAVSTASVQLNVVLDPLPKPWSRTVGEAYLRCLRAFASQLTQTSREMKPFQGTLERAALALPPECLASAAEPITMSEDSTSWYFHHFRAQLDEFADAIRTRRRIVEEIPL
jgi:hypothetical protein